MRKLTLDTLKTVSGGGGYHQPKHPEPPKHGKGKDKS